jgi:hypothetical protein
LGTPDAAPSQCAVLIRARLVKTISQQAGEIANEL